MQITPAFANPIASVAMRDCAPLNARLRELFLRWESDKSRPRKSKPTVVIKPGVYESDFYLFGNPEPEIQELAQFCLQNLGYLIAQLNEYSTAQMGKLRIYHHSWYHLTRRGGYTASHNHPMASWSGVYCVDPGDEVPTQPNNGALRFVEARVSANMYLDFGNDNLRHPYAHGDLVYSLAPGQLLLFPSYLVHEVAPYHGERERITVAFNAWVRHMNDPVFEPYDTQL